MGVSREARAHRVLVLARDVFPGPGNPTGPLAKMAVSGVFGRPTWHSSTSCVCAPLSTETRDEGSSTSTLQLELRSSQGR